MAKWKEFLKAHDLVTTMDARKREQINISWEPPLDDWICLNTGREVKLQSQVAGCVGLFRDQSRHFLGDFTRRIDMSNAFIVES